MEACAAQAMPSRKKADVWTPVEWPEGEAPPSAPPEKVRGEGLASAWKAWMRASGIDWRASRCIINMLDDAQPNPAHVKGQPAATWKLEGNIDVRSATQTDLYTRRQWMNEVILKDRVRNNFLVDKSTLTQTQNKLKSTCPADHESVTNLRFTTVLGFVLQVGLTRRLDKLDAAGEQILHLYTLRSSRRSSASTPFRFC